jgi:hypothetical protein
MQKYMYIVVMDKWSHNHKYYPIRPKIPWKQMIINQPTKLPTLSYYIDNLILFIGQNAVYSYSDASWVPSLRPKTVPDHRLLTHPS